MFKSKVLRIAIPFALALLPSSVFAQGTRGEGQLNSSSGQRANFKMWVTLNSMSPVAPFFNFDMINSTASAPSVSIQMRQLRSVVVDDRMCEFTATAVMKRWQGGVSTTTTGILKVKVLDLVTPAQPMAVADTMQLTFMGPSAAASFQYSGWVQRGDIIVWGG